MTGGKTNREGVLPIYENAGRMVFGTNGVVKRRNASSTMSSSPIEDAVLGAVSVMVMEYPDESYPRS